MSSTTDPANSPPKCPICRAVLPSVDAACLVCGTGSTPPISPEASEAVVPVKRKWPPAWGFLVVLLVPALLTAAFARIEGAAILLALGGALIAAIFGAWWTWSRIREFTVWKPLLSMLMAAVCGVVALSLNLFGCNVGGFRLHFQ